MNLTIKELRIRTGLSQSQFAKRFNIPVKTVQNWEFGCSTPRPYIVSLIHEILDLEDKISESK